MKKEKIFAVVLTYNRQYLLENLIKRLKQQTYQLDKIIIIDDASEDSTKEFLKNLNEKQIISYYLNKNVGSAGGFNFGLRKAYEQGADWIWIMDDDLLPDKDCLEKLVKTKKFLEKKNEKISFLSSQILWKDEICKMAIPGLNISSLDCLKYLEKGILELSSASYLSLLIERKALQKAGLPIREFILWNDDVEFTHRLSRQAKGFLTSISKATHLTRENYNSNLKYLNEKTLGKYTNKFRNETYMAKKYNILIFLKVVLRIEKDLLKILFSHKRKFFFKLYFAHLKGLFMNPKIEYT